MENEISSQIQKKRKTTTATKPEDKNKGKATKRAREDPGKTATIVTNQSVTLQKKQKKP